MAYTITFLETKSTVPFKAFYYLKERMAKEGVFTATLTPFIDSFNRPCIKIKPVRLVKAKAYCGNHPGECLVSAKKKPIAKYLEWQDWIKFHNLVNRVLNRFRANADVWSTPFDVKGKMWIRKGIKARKRWDWEESLSARGTLVRVWNPGTPDQY